MSVGKPHIKRQRNVGTLNSHTFVPRRGLRRSDKRRCLLCIHKLIRLKKCSTLSTIRWKKCSEHKIIRLKKCSKY